MVLQALWALALAGLVVFLLILARTASPEVSGGQKTGSAVLAVPALFAVASWYGLWKKTLWGWWLTLFTDSALLAIFLYSMVDDGLRNIDWEMAGITLISTIVPVLLMIPPVRRFYWHSPQGKD